jgi:hypothetical protein
MRLSVLATNHGKHSDEKLAYAMAADLVENASNMSGQDALDMRRLENQLGDMLAGEFRKIADREHAGIAAKGHEHLAVSLAAHADHSAELEASVLAAYKASPFADRMDMGLVAANVHEVVSKWVRTAQHMHRDWFAGAGMVGHGAALKKVEGFDKDNEHVRRWFDLHQAPTPEAYRRALHEHATGERIS